MVRISEQNLVWNFKIIEVRDPSLSISVGQQNWRNGREGPVPKSVGGEQAPPLQVPDQVGGVADASSLMP